MLSTFPPPQADCLTAFSALRTGTPNDALEIGEGCNRFPPAPFLGPYLGELTCGLTQRGGLSRYADPFNGGAQRAFADLIGCHLDTSLNGAEVFFTHGGTEAIGLIVAYLASTGHGLALPLPNYYAFDQAAARWGASVTAYYQHRGIAYATPAPRRDSVALIDVLPNGITGSIHATPSSITPAFTVLDIVYQAGSHQQHQLNTAIRERVDQLDLTRAAVIMTASKDLSLPGARAAAVITKNPELLNHLQRDAFERAATTYPLGSMVMVLYAALLPMLEVPDLQVEKLHRIASDVAESHGLPRLPTEREYMDLRRHLLAAALRNEQNTAMLRRSESPLEIPPDLSPIAGYSTFPVLKAPRGDFLDWIRKCALRGFTLNPTVVHGGTQESWDALLPAQHIRLNMSEHPTEFTAGLSQVSLNLYP